MDNQEYLSSISQDTRPVKKSASGFFSSIFFKVSAIGVAALLVVMIVGTIITGSKGNQEERTTTLKLHVDNTIEIINTYQPSLKSSTLRSYSASLASVLDNTSRDVTNYLVEKYNFKASNVEEKLKNDELALKDELNNELFEAKINALLDRTYARKMAYEILIITTREAEIIKSTSSDALKASLTSSHESLSNLYTNFNDFSETK